jgi:hypothetical protein
MQPDPDPDPDVSDIEKLVRELAEHPRGPFVPYARYSEAGDHIEVFLEDVMCVARWINHQVTVFETRDDRRIVGVEICGIKKLLKDVADAT